MRNALMNLAGGVALAVAASMAVSGCTQTATSTSAAALARPDRSNYSYTGEVYLLRGLANVFSTGLDEINQKFRRRGVNSRVDNHSIWQVWADEIVAREQRGAVSHPIIIMGHSLGGNASVQMARYLGDRGVKVAYVVAFDPTITTEPGPNVDEVVNYFLPNGRKGKDQNIVVEGPGFTGTLVNYDVTPMADINHFNVEKSPELQVRVITKAISLMKPRSTGLEPGANR